MLRAGDTAVLRNSMGGRLFVVAQVEHVEGNAARRVREQDDRAGQPEFWVWSTHLVETSSRDASLQLVAVLVHIHEEYQRRVGELVQERMREESRAARQYEAQP